MQINPDGIKIRRWREERCWSQEHLADMAGIGLRTLQRIESGNKGSRDSVMALAAAFNVDVMILMVDAESQVEQIILQKTANSSAALRLSFFIHLASYVFGLILFTAISLGDGYEGFAMLWPAIWWTVGIAGHGLAVTIVELVAHYKRLELTQSKPLKRDRA